MSSFKLIAIIGILIVAAAVGAVGAAGYLTLTNDSLPSNLVPTTSYPCQSKCYSTVVSSDTSGIGVAVAELAGLQDRTQPQIYLLGSSNTCNTGDGTLDSGNGLDRCWLNYIEQSYSGIKDNLVDADSILSNYQSLVTHGGKVLYVLYSANDPNFPIQYDMARTIASADKALPVSSSALGTLQSIYGAVNMKLDVDVSQNNCNNAADAYLSCSQWLWSNYGPETGKTNPNIMATACNGRFTSTDYYAFTDPFIFVLQPQCTNGLTTAELNWVTSTVLPYYGSTSASSHMHSYDAGYTGIGGEVPTVNELSAYGIFYVVMEDDMNLGFMAGLPPATNLQQVSQPFPKYDSNQVYIAWSYTQGNGIMWYQYRYFPIFDTSAASSVVANWQVNGMMAQLAPPILQYWIQSQSSGDQYIVSSNSGSGSYIHPEQLPNEQYWGQTFAQPYSCNAGQVDSFAQFDGQISQAELQNYQNAVNAENDLVWQGNTNGNPSGSYPSYDSGSKPQFYQLHGGHIVALPDWGASPPYDSSSAQTWASSILSSAKNNNQHFFYIDFFSATAPSLSWIQQVMADLGNKYQSVRMDAYFNLYDQANGIAPPSNSCPSTTTRQTQTSITTSQHIIGQSPFSGNWLVTSVEILSPTIIAILVVIFVATAALVYIKRR